MKIHSSEFLGEQRNMNRLLAVLFIGFALLGHSFSQYESSGDGDGDDDDGHYDENEEDSGSGPFTVCQQRKRDYSVTRAGFEPKCLPNGQFAPRQCSQEVCWCVNQHGKEIHGTKGIAVDCDVYANQDFTFEETREVKSLENDNIIWNHPGLLAGIIGGVVICLLCAVLIVMFVVYRMKKKDEGSYILGRAERKNSRSVIYTKAVPRDQEFYA